MKPTVTDKAQISFLLPDLESQINPRHPLCRLARAMDWSLFEKEFGAFYCTEGLPALPIRRMVGLLMLKSLRNHTDEGFGTKAPMRSISVGSWSFRVAGRAIRVVAFPQPDLQRGSSADSGGSIGLHGESAKEKEVVLDMTRQEPE